MSLIDNVIENAIKYSPQGRQVEVVSFRRRRHSIQRLRCRAGYSGCVENEVFDRFSAIRIRCRTGSGLGLAIVKAVAQRHNSSVSLSTSADGGLRVTVEFPARRCLKKGR